MCGHATLTSYILIEQVSIGADEYDADLANDYINFVNDMVSLSGASSLWSDRHLLNRATSSDNGTNQSVSGELKNPPIL